MMMMMIKQKLSRDKAFDWMIFPLWEILSAIAGIDITVALSAITVKTRRIGDLVLLNFEDEKTPVHSVENILHLKS